MKLNCRPGDLAVLIRNSTGMQCYDGLVGLTLTVDEIAGVSPYFGVAWRKRGASVPCPLCGGAVRNFIDADLQPIRPPAKGDATDEMVERVGPAPVVVAEGLEA